MFKSEFGIFGCENGYACFEQFCIAGLAIFSLYHFIRAYQIIRRDRAQVLDRMDKIIFYLCFFHIGLVSFTQFLYVSPLLSYTLRTVYLIQDVVLCTVIAYIYFKEEVYNTLHRMMQGGLVVCIFLWFIAVVGKRDKDPDNECTKNILLVFSGYGLLISSALAFLGYKCIKVIDQTLGELDAQDLETSIDAETLFAQRRRDELDGRKIQITILAGVNLISTLVQFMWDIKKHNEHYSQLQCDKLTYSHSIYNLLTFIAMKSFCYLLPSWGIFYSMYWRNKSNFKAEQDFDRRNSDFDDLRSELVE